MAIDRAQAAATFRRVEEVAQRFLNYSVADQGFVLHDTAIEQAVLARCPFLLKYPRSTASNCIHAIAAQLAKKQSAVEGGGLLKRVVGMFV
jgi:MinD-like ATPase involved in chromosome partitioning or flagellar assembly